MSPTTLLLLIVVIGLGLVVLFILFLRRRRRQAAPKKAAAKQPSGKRPAKQPPAKQSTTVVVASKPVRPSQADAAARPAPAASIPTPARTTTPVPAPAPRPGPAPIRSESGDKIRILVVDDNPDTRGHVSRLLYFEDDMEVIGQAINGRQGIEMAVEYRPHIVLMDINMPDVDGITATQEMSVRAPYSQVIIMTVQAEQHYMKQAMAAGARDFQPKPFTSEELVNCVRRVYSHSLPIYQQLEAAHQVQVQKAAQTQAQQSENGAGTRVIAVYSPKGGIGTSTIAANLAVALQQRYGDIVLMDADLQFGDILVHLNTRPTRTMSDLVHEDGFDLELVNDVLLPHSSGLKLLLAPPQPELADAVSVEMIAGLIKSLKRDFRAVVVDSTHKLDDKTMAVLENADYILLILSPELPAIKSGKLFLELYDRLEYDRARLGVVINKADLAGGISPTKIEKILKVGYTFRIPHDPRMILAINRGIVVAQQEPNSPSAQAIIQLAAEIGQKLAEIKDTLPVPQ